MIVMNASVPTNAAATMPVALAGNVRKMNARDFECCNDDGCDEKAVYSNNICIPIDVPCECPSPYICDDNHKCICPYPCCEDDDCDNGWVCVSNECEIVCQCDCSPPYTCNDYCDCICPYECCKDDDCNGDTYCGSDYTCYDPPA